MIRPTLAEQFVAARRRERFLLGILVGTWGGHLATSHASLPSQTLAMLLVLVVAAIFAGWHLINLALDSLRFRRVHLSSSPRNSAPASVKPESQPGRVSPADTVGQPAYRFECPACAAGVLFDSVLCVTCAGRGWL